MYNGSETGLYCNRFEHDACGIGAVINIKGKQEHKVVDDALSIVEKLEHRAGKDSSGEIGDGVGIMLKISHNFFSKHSDFELGNELDYGIGMFFLPKSTLKQKQAMSLFEVIAKKEDVHIIGWRKVPVSPEILSEKLSESVPAVYQCFIKRPDNIQKGIDFDRKLYVIRRVFEQSNTDTHIASLSSRTIVYKGMFLVHQLRKFYKDLQSKDYTSSIALVHSRFSTNTAPGWERAHPNRMILHNGEINTIRGNADRMLAREETMVSEYFPDEPEKILPVINAYGSDSAMLDNTIEFMVMNGIDLPLAMMITIPEPWDKIKTVNRAKRDFYKYYSTMMEPWDGPAAILFSDGDIVGATLDRNGLRPSRYYITTDGYLILASEVGVLDIAPEKILKKSRLYPGKMLLIDTVKGEIIDDEALKREYASKNPYGEWLDRYLKKLTDLKIPNQKIETYDKAMRECLYKAFGYSYEDIRNTILPMAKNGIEATSAMGVDIPIAVISPKHQPLFSYFKQIFAQVTNPPIDAIREEIVTSTIVYIGADGNLLTETGENCRVLQIDNPILTNTDLLKIKELDEPGLKSATVPLLYYKNTSLKKAVEQLFIKCDKAYKNGANIIILSDRGVDENHVAIPSLLAVSAVEQYLIRTKKRTSISIIIETAEPRDVHHFALLLGYGARAVNPYLAHEAIHELIEYGMLNKDFYAAISDYNSAILRGIVKVASKMGISTLQSYQSAQVFEAVGINKETIDQYFTNTISRIGGIGIEQIGEAVEWNHSHAFDPLGLGIDTSPESTGEHRLINGTDKEEHIYTPKTIIKLQQATRSGDYNAFKEYTAMVNDETKPHTLRGLFEFDFDNLTPIPLSEVESVKSIVKRFKTGAMSYGSISQEAHECLAKAMNTIGGKSNSGEGGELPERLTSGLSSSIKQVASGRFGVTSEYLLSAKEIQIKMAQGAKPGEGGHLPGRKVYPWIAKTRHSTPGVSLISPPPHHDIYSIEDLAQLIYDLKNANREALISVKLVSEAGVGTIAAGVAKAGAGVILISGYDGGTGAAPKSSIHNAGLPWELGLAETHQALIMSGLRSKVKLETDGKLMSGRDVAIACMLGAEEFGFSTAPLVSMGCIMMRVCNLDTCPVGIATQNPILRKRFSGKPEYVINFMSFIAEELREIMAKAGIRTVDELVGRTDLLRAKNKNSASKSSYLNLDKILFGSVGGKKTHFDKNDLYCFNLRNTIDEQILLKEFKKSLKTGEKCSININVTSTDRTLGTILGSEITKNFRNTLKDDTFTVNCTGGGGQSFGAFIPKGLTLRLEGDSNDYFGKGLSGGKLVVYPPKNSSFKAHENIIIGNVALYGATSGSAYICGISGERFCVRNSGATAVTEGAGDHALEYMTGGTVVILGKTGKNLAAGMSGGTAYVYDPDHDLYMRANKELVEILEIQSDEDSAELKSIIKKHYSETASELAEKILGNFEEELLNFKKIIPKDYNDIITAVAQAEKQGMSKEDAEIHAFYSVTGG